MAEPEVGPKASWVPTQERIVYDGGFRTNIGAFLEQFGNPITLQTGAAPVRAWSVDVKETEEDAHPLVQLYVYEDPADVSRPPVCDHCRIIGVLKISISLVPCQREAQSRLCCSMKDPQWSPHSCTCQSYADTPAAT